MKILKYPNIEAERARRGLNVDELATILGVSKKTYYNWISQGRIPLNKLSMMSDFFGVSSDYLLAGFPVKEGA